MILLWVKRIKLLEYDRIDISEGIDVNKTSLSEECDICHYWYFKNIGFRYEPYLCNGCQDDAINIINGSNLVDKKGVL